MKLKLIFIAVICVLSSSFTNAQNIEAITTDGKKVILRPDKTWEYAQSKPINISFQNEEININNTKFTLPIEREKLFAILGQPSRRSPLANTIYTWDDTGVIAYEKPSQSIIFCLAFILDNTTMDDVFTPKLPFKGNLIIDGARINSNSTLEEINRSKKGDLFYDSTLSCCSEMERGNLTVFLEYALPERNKKGKVIQVDIEYTEE